MFCVSGTPVYAGNKWVTPGDQLLRLFEAVCSFISMATKGKIEFESGLVTTLHAPWPYSSCPNLSSTHTLPHILPSINTILLGFSNIDRVALLLLPPKHSQVWVTLMLHLRLHLAATFYGRSLLVYLLCILIIPCEHIHHSFNYLLSYCYVLDIKDTKMDTTLVLKFLII